MLIHGFAPPAIVFLDMEGTLLQKAHHLDDGRVAPSAWTLLAERLGKQCLEDENKTKDQWKAGEYRGYLHWMRDTVAIHQRYGLTRSIFEDVLRSVELTPGAVEALAKIHSWGSVTVLLTGGFKALADRTQRLLGIHHSFAACEYFFSESGSLEYWNLLPTDEAGRVDFMRLICREYEVDARDCVFVGDGQNDVHMAKEVGFSVAFNAQDALRNVATVCVEQPRDEVHFSAVPAAIERSFRRAAGLGRNMEVSR